ncbi:MAG TPA: hypothetical protein VGH29_15345, partial [Candidatus Binataceae bacterium]
IKTITSSSKIAAGRPLRTAQKVRSPGYRSPKTKTAQAALRTVGERAENADRRRAPGTMVARAKAQNWRSLIPWRDLL